MGDSTDEKAGKATDSRPESSEKKLPGEDQAAKAARAEREAEFKDYLRIFSYATRWDYLLMVAAALASLGAGTVSFVPDSLCYRSCKSWTNTTAQ